MEGMRRLIIQPAVNKGWGAAVSGRFQSFTTDFRQSSCNGFRLPWLLKLEKGLALAPARRCGLDDVAAVTPLYRAHLLPLAPNGDSQHQKAWRIQCLNAFSATFTTLAKIEISTFQVISTRDHTVFQLATYYCVREKQDY